MASAKRLPGATVELRVVVTLAPTAHFFTDVTTAAGVGVTGHSVAWADYDGDGQAELTEKALAGMLRSYSLMVK